MPWDVTAVNPFDEALSRIGNEDLVCNEPLLSWKPRPAETDSEFETGSSN